MFDILAFHSDKMEVYVNTIEVFATKFIKTPFELGYFIHPTICKN